MEKYHDLALRGRAGAVQLEVNAVGRVIRELDRQEGVPGEDVGLTSTPELQQAVLTMLGDESASAVVLDCRNGEVLAMATNPSFDPDRCSIPASHRRNGRSGPTTGARR